MFHSLYNFFERLNREKRWQEAVSIELFWGKIKAAELLDGNKVGGPHVEMSQRTESTWESDLQIEIEWKLSDTITWLAVS